MSIHVTDPSGMRWTISRRTFDLPPWPGGPVLPDTTAVMAADSLAGFVALSGLFVVLLAALVVAFAMPVLVFLAGLLVALGLLAARLMAITPWVVEARSAERSYTWTVRGVVRSGRAMRRIAAAIGGGDVPTVDGVAGQSV